MQPAEIEKDKFFEFAGFKKGDFVWDFGCGEGRFSWSLNGMGCHWYGTDMKTYNTPPKEKVDKFLLSCVLHYNPDKLPILKTAYDSLKEGGQIVIIEPNPLNTFFYCLYFWRWLKRSKCPRRWINERYMSTQLELEYMLFNMKFRKIEVMKYAWLPSKFGLFKLNEALNRIPFINWFNAFNWVRAVK